ncbi:MAG: DUF2911 domain-containing protein [Bacteroidetes bacterium]|nr:DUF2911 domain-containing protein [Bacteroidota bacterium]
MKKLLCLLTLSAVLFLQASSQQLKTPAPSPPQFVRQDFGLSSIELSYSRPGIKGRNIFGDLVPFGKVWRTGANSATTLTFGDDVTIGGTKIAAGKYGLLTIPGEHEWTFIITKQLDVTNPSAYKQDQDVVRVTAQVEHLPFAVETFSILFNDVTSTSCNLELVWDRTAVALPIKTDIDSKIMSQINDAINKDNKPYFSAAMYYLDNGKDLNKALEWFNKALEANPDAYFIVYQKARCQAKLGKKQDAIATAQKGIDLAKTAKNDDYVALNEKLIASLK